MSAEIGVSEWVEWSKFYIWKNKWWSGGKQVAFKAEILFDIYRGVFCHYYKMIACL